MRFPLRAFVSILGALILQSTSDAVNSNVGAFLSRQKIFTQQQASQHVETTSCFHRVETPVRRQRSLCMAKPRQAPEDMGYTVKVKKPLGVVFRDNRKPYFGLAVDDVEPGLNGGAAGLKAGDNLLTINGRSVIGMDFDEAMDILVKSDKELILQLYRGPVRTVFSILEAKLGPNDNDVDDEDDSQAVVMDENYVTPVVVPVDTEDERDYSITPANIFGALFGFPEDKEEQPEIDTPQIQEDTDEPKSGGGFFGNLFGVGETIQLDGEDAAGYKSQNIDKDKREQEVAAISDDPLSGLKSVGTFFAAKKDDQPQEPPTEKKEVKKEDSGANIFTNLFDGFTSKKDD